MSLQAKLDALTSAHGAASDPSKTALREAIMKLIDDEEHARPLKVGDCRHVLNCGPTTICPWSRMNC
jgi:hypothetical protein